MNKILFFLLFYLICFSALSQEQLTDLVTSPNDGNSGINGYVEYNDLLVFTTTTSSEGLELWKTDGTADGTRIIKDIYPGATGSIKSRKLIVLNNSIYFLADNGSIETQLWKSDGTEASTVRVTDFLSGDISRLTLVGNQLFFLINTFTNNWEIWKSDGTEAGTVPVKKSITSWNSPDGFISAGGLFYVALQTKSPNLVDVWRSDGTEAGTFPVIENIGGNGAGAINGNGGTNYLTQYIEFNNELYFVARSGAVFGQSSSVGIIKTNGTVSGTVALKGVHDGNRQLLEYADVIEWKNKLYFSFFNADLNHHFIWETNGTESGTRKVYEVMNDTYFVPSNLSSSETALMFAAPGSNGGSSLITFNPLSNVTEELKSISNPTQKPLIFDLNSHLSYITKGVNKYYINVQIGNNAAYPASKRTCLSDGTKQGTILIDNVRQSNGFELKVPYFNGNFYFPGYEQASGTELWRSDGTLAGTYLLKNINVGKESGLDKSLLFLLDDKVFFNPVDSISGNELWQSDGTKQGTALVKDINPGKRGSFPFGNLSFAKIGNNFLFSPYEPIYGGELWKTDGTSEGTILLKDLLPGTTSSLPELFTQSGNTVFFVARITDGKKYLWKTDGTSDGTIMLKGLGTNSYNIPLSVERMTTANKNVFFEVINEGKDLWKSDGTEAGTIKLKDFSNINDLFTVNNIAYLIKPSSTYGQYELWKSDGTTEGTLLVTDFPGNQLSPPKILTNLGDKILLTVTHPLSGRELWLSDGTTEGTTLLKDIAPGTISGISALPSFVKKGDKIYFQADDYEHGAELWQTDGTGAGTILIKDILPGSQGSYPNNLALGNNLIFFAAFTPEYGMELWKSNGTAEGTILAADVLLGAAQSNPAKILAVGNNIFFIADSKQYGKQLWNLVQKQNQQITFNAIATKVFEDAPFELTAVASSGLPVAFSIVSGPAALSGKVLTIQGAGQIVVKAFQAGDNTYNSALVEQTFIVNKASQSISFPFMEDRAINETPIELVATSSSGFPISFTLISGQATIVNNILTINEPGRISVKAFQNGNENYNSASSVERAFTVSAVLGSEDELSAKVQLFPNPTSDYLFITVPKEFYQSSIRIVDIKGKIVAVQKVNGQESISLQIRQLPKGLYILQIIHPRYRVNRKFLIN